MLELVLIFHSAIFFFCWPVCFLPSAPQYNCYIGSTILKLLIITIHAIKIDKLFLSIVDIHMRIHKF